MTSSDWATASNWETYTVPTASDDVKIDGPFTNEPVLQTTDATCKDLYIASGITLSLEKTSSLIVSGDLTVSGTFVMGSDDDEFSSLIVQGTATGDITYNRYIRLDGSLIGFPVGNVTIHDFLIANEGLIKTNGSDYSLSQYDNANGDFTPFSPSNIIGKGQTCQGYAVSHTSGGVVAFTGTVHTSDQTKNIINNAAKADGGTRWNFVSNPYPSYINGTQFLTVNSAVIDPNFYAVYMWNGEGFTIKYGVDFSIAPGQGFWVAAKSSSTSLLSFLTSMRTNNIGDDAVWENFSGNGDYERVPNTAWDDERVPNTAYCTCPNGTPTVFGGTDGTLCEDDYEDCSACNAGYTLSADAAAGAQRCDDNCLVNRPASSCAALKACNTLHCANSCGEGSLCQAYAAQWKLLSCDCQ